LGELLLRPSSLGPQDAHPALHSLEERMRGVTIPNAPQKSG
jgi:hypothetical protein